METFHALVLGIVQGITEFLPISSSGHLILVPWFFGWEDPGQAFDVFLHLGTLLALVAYFFKDWCGLAKAGISSIIERRIGYDRQRLMFWLIVVATIPAGAAGYLFAHQIETAFRVPLLVAMTMAGVGFLLYWIDGRYPALRSIDELRFKDAILIGLAQACALVPGVSRSGSTMTMARFLGMNREAAARFSFLMSVPITAAACLHQIGKLNSSEMVSVSNSYLIAGFAASLISGLASIHFLLQFLKASDFRIFAWYRLILAAIVIATSLLTGR